MFKGECKKVNDNIGKWVRHLYKIFVKYWVMVWLPLLLMAVCFALDCCSCQYYSWAEDFFKIEDGDFTGIGCIIMVIWTFTTTLLVFYIGRAEDKRYGIKIVEITRWDYCNLKIACSGISFMFGLLSILGAVKHQWEITLSLHIWLQAFWMIYVLLLIYVEMSDVHIQEVIKKDTVKEFKQGQISWFLKKMLNNLEYGDDKELDKICSIWEYVEKEVSEESVVKGGSSRGTSLEIENFVAKCMEYIMQTVDDRKGIAIIIKKCWLKDIDIRIKRGIFAGVLDNIYSEKAPCMENLVEMTFKDKRKILTWGVVYNGFWDELSDERGGRLHIAGILWQELQNHVEDEEEQEMLRQWENLVEQKIGIQEKNGLKDYYMDKMARVIVPDWRGSY